MEENTNQVSAPTQSSNKTILVVSLVAIALVIYVISSKPNVDNKVQPTQTTQTTEQEVTPVVSNATYKDGVYEVKGDYTSPGGAEQIDVKLTLVGNVVSEAEVVSLAERPMSKKFQGEFVAGYKEFVVGKNINEIMVGKISGSSLTPKGFNDAVEKIKAQAKS